MYNPGIQMQRIDNRYMRRWLLIGACVLGTLGMVACGGGGGGGDSVFDSEWEPGVFLPAGTYWARCANPRSGINPVTNRPFSDIQGSVYDENNFLRSYSNDTYLWYNEIVDRDPWDYTNPRAYFSLLKTTALTPSGRRKDRFHFTVPSDEWFQVSQSGVSAGYGAAFVFVSSDPPREVVVAYTEPNSPATNPAANLVRGTRILAVDGVDVDDATNSGIDTIYDGLFPDNAGEVHSFEVLDPGAPQSRTVSLTSANVTSESVKFVSVIPTLSGPVGYLLFNDHIATAEQALIDAVNQLNAAPGITDLVLDLRYNGGGFLDIASELAYMIAGPVPTAGRPFETLQFNNKHPATNPVTGNPLAPTPFYSTTQGFSVPSGQALPTLGLQRVFVLTGSSTCSASESIVNSLRGVNVQVFQFGSTTCGKPYGFYPTDNCGTTYFTIQFRGVNAANYGDYTDGFSPQNTAADPGELLPGCSVADDFDSPLGEPAEARLAAALGYRESPGTCPVASGRPGPGRFLREATRSPFDGDMPKDPWRNNRILRQ